VIKGWVLGCGLCSSALAGNLRLEAESRAFFHSGQAAQSVAAQFEAKGQVNGLKWRIDAFARQFDPDPNRNTLDLRQALITAKQGAQEVQLGVGKVFWGVTESRHLVDVVNTPDFAQDLDGEAKLGQALISFSQSFDGAGRLTAYVLPFSREATIATLHPRLPFPLAGESRFQSPNQTALAARWQGRGENYGVAWDVAGSYFQGRARLPDFLPCLRQGSGFSNTQNQNNCDLAGLMNAPPNLPPALINVLTALGLLPSEAELRRLAEQNLVLVPFTPQEQRLGLELQAVQGAVAYKLEALYRQRGTFMAARQSTWAAVAGVEISDQWRGWDVGYLAEFLYDQQRGLLQGRFDHDVFVGFRLSLNDVGGSTALGGVVLDRSGKEPLYTLKMQRRLSDDWRIGLNYRQFSGLQNPLERSVLRDDSRVGLVLERFF
jgi:hypothetical protein